jgi:uncharacterized membrane protein
MRMSQVILFHWENEGKTKENISTCVWLLKFYWLKYTKSTNSTESCEYYFLIFLIISTVVSVCYGIVNVLDFNGTW